MSISINCTHSNPVSLPGAPTPGNEGWNFGSTTCDVLGIPPIFLATSTISTTSDIYVGGYFSVGDIFISVLLFLIIMLKLIELMARGLSGIITKRTFLQYGGGDVEIRKDL